MLRLVLVALVARVPNASLGVVVTLHVVGPLGKGYAQAGLVEASATKPTAPGAAADRDRIESPELDRDLS
ncbi:MAG TPA: hypothetical protein VIM26_07275 [Pengzhenrongella sp.]